MRNTSLSVIVPVYNVETFIKDCLDSIEQNTYQDVEIILVDDGSTDKSGLICDSYSERDSRIKVIHQQNKGQSSARNVALDIAKGDYVTFVDADDMITSDTIEANMRILSDNPEIDILQYPITKSKESWTENKMNITETVHSDVEHLFDLWLRMRKISNYVCNKFFKRHCFESLRFREGMYYEDRYLMCDLLKACENFCFSSHGLYFYRTHDSQTTKKRYSPYTLSSLINADLHIYHTVVAYESFRDIALERYNNCLFYYGYAKSKNWNMGKELKKELSLYKPSLSYILTSHVSCGIKIRLFISLILGVDFLSRRII